MRTCIKCGKEFPLTKEYFYTNSGLFRGECKTCFVAYSKQRRIERIRANYKIALSAKNCADPELANEIFRIRELRNLEVEPELAERILHMPNVDKYSPAKLAKIFKCRSEIIKSVLLNEQRWRETFKDNSVEKICF